VRSNQGGLTIGRPGSEAARRGNDGAWRVSRRGLVGSERECNGDRRVVEAVMEMQQLLLNLRVSSEQSGWAMDNGLRDGI
jgi:hypothetical protein